MSITALFKKVLPGRCTNRAIFQINRASQIKNKFCLVYRFQNGLCLVVVPVEPYLKSTASQNENNFRLVYRFQNGICLFVYVLLFLTYLVKSEHLRKVVLMKHFHRSIV